MTWRPMTASERQLAWIWGGLVLASIALVPLWTRMAALAPPCLFRRVTGVPCPSCGTTRGVLSLIDGRALDALALNPLMISGLVAVVVAGVVAPLWAWRPGRLPRIQHPLPRWFRIAAVLALLANWAWVISVL